MIQKINQWLLLLGIIAVGVIILSISKKIPTIGNWFKSQPVLIDETPILIKEIKQLGQLVSITIFDEVVVDSMKLRAPSITERLIQMAGPMPITNISADELVLIAKGKVLAGTDLQQLQPEKIFIKGDSVSIQLPEAQILEVISNPSDFETFSETGTWQDFEIAAVKNSAKRKILDRALAKNILSKANDQSVLVMTNFLRTLGFKKVRVTI